MLIELDYGEEEAQKRHVSCSDGMEDEGEYKSNDEVEMLSK